MAADPTPYPKLPHPRRRLFELGMGGFGWELLVGGVGGWRLRGLGKGHL